MPVALAHVSLGRPDRRRDRRGSGPAQSALWFPRGLGEIHPKAGHTSTARPIEPPPKGWGVPSMNFVGLVTRSPSVLEPAGTWFESLPPEQLQPRDLHAAQLARRSAP